MGILFLGCYEDSEEITETIEKPIPSKIITEANLVVNVQDETGLPISGISAHFNHQNKVINQASYFHFLSKNISKENEILTVTDGKGHSFDFSMYTIENEVNYHTITLFKNVQEIAFSSAQDQNLTSPSGNINLHLSPNNYTVDQEKYAGNIQGRFYEINTFNPTHLKALPGGQIIHQNGVQKFIQFHVAFNIELTTPAQKTVSCRSSQKVEIVNIVPTESVILYYNKVSKRWENKGIYSAKNGIPFTESGFYALADLEDISILKGQWLLNDFPMMNQKIKYEFNNITQETYTSNTGKWEIIVSRNTLITISHDHECSVNTEKIMVQTDKNQVETNIKNFVTLEWENVSIKGSFKSCDHLPIHEGFIIVQNGIDPIQIYIPRSTFSINLPLCTQDDVNIATSSTTSSPTSLIRYTGKNIALGQIFLCETFTDNYVALKTQETYSNLTTLLEAKEDAGIFNFTFEYSGQVFNLKFKHNNQAGNIDPSSTNIVWIDPNFDGKGIELLCPTSTSCGFDEVELYTFEKNGWIKGRFKGEFWVKNNNPLTARYQQLEGEFQINQK